MSVVYKGMDTSLNREVAVKVLHPHLAAHDEARQRFEREAHAVAKLRHENILEIFDYSGRESADSYIVTEFIKGRTLRSFIGEHQMAFPEIAALIVVEVCRALAHAHKLGVLHRDVKPENIMIRDDGVLKLMDFGIAQIVDSHRMTVTGQLLGSPAYMSPEHVEGRPLDFRTDVFSVGILLYQLATGELPFKGRNPHEILKRIAECRYLDARVVNPLVADRLNAIIKRALARLPDERYADVSLLLDDLTRFLSECDLTEPRQELERFFRKPLPYEQALRQRLIAAFTRRGKEELAARHTARALELWNRVLTIDPANDEVLRLIDRLSRRRRIRWGLVAGVGLLAASSAVALTWTDVNGAPPVAPPPPAPVAEAAVLPPAVADARVEVAMVTVEPDAAPPEVVEITPPPVEEPRRRPRPPRAIPTSSKPVAEPRPGPVLGSRTFRMVPWPRNASYSIDGGDFRQVSMGGAYETLGPGAHKITFRHDMCHERVHRVEADERGGDVLVRLPWKATRVVVRCARATAITINGRPFDDGGAADILEFDDGGKAPVTVEFLVDGRTQRKAMKVTAGKPTTEVSCEGS
jgi:serine/threonine-protein kinase